MPDLAAGAAVDRPRVVGRRHIQHTIHLEDRPLHLSGAIPGDVPDTALHYGDARRTGAIGEPPCPRQREALDVGLIDLRQRAVAPARIVAVVRGPGLAERFTEKGPVSPALRAQRER